MTHTLYELDVRLREIKPPIWRTIEIAGASTLEDVHYAIQVAMGWTNSHLHQFTIGKHRYGITAGEGAEDRELEEEREFKLQDLKQGDKFVYEYDFGDGWEHDVVVNKVTTQAKAPVPRCTAGARACPPEDSGGPHRYPYLLEALGDPKHPDHKELKSWSDNFKPERFTVPKGLQTSMDDLKAMAEEAQVEDLGLPPLLVEAALSLEPMQRASLIALIAASLANELNNR